MVMTSRTAGGRRSAPRAVYTARTCGECKVELPPESSVNRVYCDRCRDRRRGITFLRKAQEHFEELGNQSINGALEALIGAAEVAR